MVRRTWAWILSWRRPKGTSIVRAVAGPRGESVSLPRPRRHEDSRTRIMASMLDGGAGRPLQL